LTTQQTQEKPSSGGSRRIGKTVIVLALLVAVVATLYLKDRNKPETEPSTVELAPTVPEESVVEVSVASDSVLAIVNGELIIERKLEKTLRQLPPQYRSSFENQKHEFLEEMITRALLLNEANRLDVASTEAYRTAVAGRRGSEDYEENALINVLINSEVTMNVEVTDDDLRRFYEEHKAEIRGQPPFEEVRETLLPSVRQQMQYQAVEDYIAFLKEEANIIRNRKWIEVQKKSAADNPLDRALASGKPVLVDFGQLTCLPCKMMKPILDELTEELKGQVHVIFLDTRDYGYLARRYNIRVIPVQIFFDASGTELYRHEGFMPKEDIQTKLKEFELLISHK